MSFLLQFRDYLKNSLNEEQKTNIQKFQGLKFRGLQNFVYHLVFGSNLKALAVIYHTDKWGTHWYSQHYETHFSAIRNKKLNILEIGIGGYEDPERGGGSLRMWRTFFPKSRIFGIDIHDKSPHNEGRIQTFKGSQVDNNFLEKVLEKIGKVDIIIDDGSHRNDHVIHTFKYLFPKLGDNGIYVIEDTQTSYWPWEGGSYDNLNSLETSMGFLKHLTDGINYSEYPNKDYQPSYFDQHIVAVHFYHNIVFIQKGLNNEKSNMINK